MLRLSFIVPFYNVEPYIEECIRSLYNQDIPWEDYEVICVDDCSPDGSRVIVERLQKEYPTLKLLKTPENLRQGGARNMGLDVAQGKYIWFVDSDDVIATNCLKSMLETAEEKQLDVLTFYFDSYERPLTAKEKLNLFEFGICTGSEFVFDAPLDVFPASRCCSAVKELIRKELLVKNQIRFVEKVQFEDDDYAYQVFGYSVRTYLMPIAPYIVRKVQNSTTRKAVSLQKILDINAQLERIVVLCPQLIKLDRRWCDLISQHINWSIPAQILSPLKTVPAYSQLSFFIQRRGWIRNLSTFVNTKLWLAMHSFICFKVFF